MTRGTLAAAAFATCVLVLTACAAKGPPFQAIDLIPEAKALVYIYRAPRFAGSGVVYDVRIKDTEIITLRAGGYYPYFAEPGETEFWARTEARASVTEDLNAGETYYLKGDTGFGFFIGHPKLMFVSEQVGQAEIAKCKLLSK
jgi:hypothetical protein